MYSAVNDTELVTYVEVTKKLVTEETYTLRVTSNADPYESIAEDSTPLEEEVIYYICLC